MLMLVATPDLLEILATAFVAVPVAGQIFYGLVLILDFIILPIILFWLRIRGVKGLWFLAGSMLEFIPIIDILPIRTLTLLLVYYLANNPNKAFALVRKLSAKPSVKLKGAKAT
mgnify:FL=1